MRGRSGFELYEQEQIGSTNHPLRPPAHASSGKENGVKSYGDLQLTVSSPAQTFTEPLSLEEAKGFLKVSSMSEDFLIERMISSAREVAEIHQGIDLIEKQYDLHIDQLCGSEVELRRPLLSVDSFQITDSGGSTTTLVQGTDYIVDLNRNLVMPPYAQAWPSFTPYPSSAILIRFTSGYSRTHPFWLDAGNRILMGMHMLITGWHENRLPYNPDRPGAVTELPFAVTALLSYGARPRVH